ncbi:MAG: hypothetical protein ACOH5I_08335 [Oligoflexus sp.]
MMKNYLNTLLFIALVGLVQGCKAPSSQNDGGSSAAHSNLIIDGLSGDDTDFIDKADARREASDEVDEVNPLSQCGFDDVNDATTPFFDQTLAYAYTRIFNGGLAQITVDLSASLRLGSSQEETFFQLGLDVLGTGATDLATGEPITDTSIVFDGASEQTADFKGNVDSEAFPLRSNFHPQWKKILCTLPGAERIVTTLGGFETEVEIVPGYPAAISPAADPERYEEELGEFRAFTNIEAKVVRTNNPDLEEGRTYIGSVLVEKIVPELILPNGSKIISDIAYRMTYRFGTEEETRGLGFLIWTENYIDHETREFAAMKANMGSQSEINYFLPANINY